MAGSATVTAGELWLAIRREAEAAIAADPFLEASAAFILDQGDLGGALAFLIGRHISRAEEDRAQFARTAREAYAAEPVLVDAAATDLTAIVRRDPAITGFLPPLLNFKGFVALQAWRVSNWLWRQDRPDLALMMQSATADQLQISIHPSARIGTAVFLDHGTGIIIGALASVGDEVTILQNVTIARHQDDPRRAPKIGHGVLLSAGATVIGHLSIGDFARIGAGALVTTDVPAGCTAIGVPARLTNCAEAGTLS
ncbi:MULTISPECIES: serine O-acetyltransferase [Bradyrhizobium]|uniref:Serine acetyltransferase n=1 Tax=Bradyrhizobium brasilense TaxID=1419277 RepID=A0ABY8JDL3_9BRAD|nr:MULTISPECIES: serine acetyltransferase [Bradyrhizobium]MCP1910321.1 serine O-acetyltransferase [Bradyrhizobium elkanii]KRQ10493.1 serine acetyltransferase [Bradyrhizobium pachyrhizi]MCP1836271.1 serine O-acetyltransferase [Bradyrhizobium sp. USDA 4545]MCP1846333.1 serine O-acetyltransferase [Bradyrhizobium sp. USDA 4541]MCP1921020.1 serine O-acetyltransferase [Bradyrhizobium sp. USDA 4532]